MKRKLTRYQEIVLRDVKNAAYERHRHALWGTFGIFGAVMVAFYAVFFHGKVISYFQFLALMHQTATTSADPHFKAAIYMYHHLLLFFLFIGAVLLLSLLAFFAFDMQARNQIIRSLRPRPDPVLTWAMKRPVTK